MRNDEIIMSMKKKDILKFDFNDLIILNRDRKVIIHRKKYKTSVRLNREVFEYFCYANKNNMTIGDFVECFDREEDKNYIREVINMLKDKKILSNGRCGDKVYFKDIYLALTNRCNLKCVHCASHSSPNENDKLKYNDICFILDNIALLNTRRLILTGGEPLVREDFYQIVNYINNNKICKELYLSTNGTLINKNNVEFIVKNFDRIDMSLDGVDEKSCSLIRGKNVFNKVINTVNLLHEKNFYNITLSMVFDQKNIDRFEEFRLLNKNMNTIPIERYFEPVGRGISNKSIFTEDESFLPLSISTINEYMLDTGNDSYNKYTPFSCNACEEQLFINYDGEMYPCPSLVKSSYRLGSSMDMKIINKIKLNNLDGFAGYINLKKIYPYYYDKCKKCDVNLFCLKCPAKVDLIKDSDSLHDEWCRCMKYNIGRIVWGES